MSSLLTSFKVSSKLTDVKVKAASLLTLDAFRLNNRDTRMFFGTFISFSNWIRNVRGIANKLLINFISKFGTTLMKELWKIFANSSSFQINWLFRCRFMNTFDLILFEKSGFTLAQSFLLSQRFLISRFSKCTLSDLRRIVTLILFACYNSI